MSSSKSNKIRTVLGEYKVGKTLGEGSFSKVKLATHTTTGEKFAVKIIDKKMMNDVAVRTKKANDERERQRIIAERKKARRESIKVENMAQENSDAANGEPVDLHKIISGLAKINAELENVQVPTEPVRPEQEYMPSIQKEVKLMMRLNHPNVIKTYKVFDSEDECYVVMELAKGGELMEYIISHGKLSEKEARKFFRQIVSAMAHIHQASIVHRDLKLENILLSQDINCLISDFGLGRTFQEDQMEDMKTFCGTPNYASAELVAGIPYNGVKSDIWSMGVILYIMVSGKRPFIGSTIAVLYQKILKLDYEIPAYFSPELVDLLKSIFVRDPKKRIDINGIKNHRWINIDNPEKIPFLTAEPIPEDAEEIGKAIASVHNEGEFTVYTLKSHNSKRPSPSPSEVAVAQSSASKSRLNRTSSLRIVSRLERGQSSTAVNKLQESISLSSNRRASISGKNSDVVSTDILAKPGNVPSNITNIATESSTGYSPSSADGEHSIISPLRSFSYKAKEDGSTDSSDISALADLAVIQAKIGIRPTTDFTIQEEESVHTQTDQPDALEKITEHVVREFSQDADYSQDDEEGFLDWPEISIEPPKSRRTSVQMQSGIGRRIERRSSAISMEYQAPMMVLGRRKSSISSHPKSQLGLDQPRVPDPNLFKASDSRHSSVHETIQSSRTRIAADSRHSSVNEPTQLAPRQEPPQQRLPYRRSSLHENAIRRPSMSFNENINPNPKKVIHEEFILPNALNILPNALKASSSLMESSELNSTDIYRKRAITVSGSNWVKSSDGSKLNYNGEKMTDIWCEDSKIASSSINESKRAIETETSSLMASIIIEKAHPYLTMDNMEAWHLIHRPAKTIRTMRYSFQKGTTSNFDPARIFQDIHRALTDLADDNQDYFSIKFHRPNMDHYLFECLVEYPMKDEIVKFDIEVCKVWLLKLHGVRIKRKQGDPFDYKQINNGFVAKLATYLQ